MSIISKRDKVSGNIHDQTRRIFKESLLEKDLNKKIGMTFSHPYRINFLLIHLPCFDQPVSLRSGHPLVLRV